MVCHAGSALADHDHAGALYPNMPQLGSSSEADVDSDEEVLVNPDRPAPCEFIVSISRLLVCL